MFTRSRIATMAVCLVMTAACGGGPTGPSGGGGATISGTVNVNGGALTLARAAARTMTVSVVGTSQSTTVEDSGYFHLPNVTAETVRLQFRDAGVDATLELSNVGQQQYIEIQVEVSATAAVVVSDVRSNNKVSLCHSTGNGSYHQIDVSDSAEPAHRAHGDGKVGDPVPGTQRMVFDASCRPSGPAVEIEKRTNGEDADEAPGPAILVGAAITWQYIVSNTGTIALTGVSVSDDRNVSVTCPGTTLAVGQSMTCTGSGTAVSGQYRNVGTVTASSASGTVTATDASHYFGLLPPEASDGPRVQLCHRTGNGRYNLIEVSASAVPAHIAHGDGRPGEAVPGSAGRFGATCSVQ